MKIEIETLIVGTISDPAIKHLVAAFYGDVVNDYTAQVQLPYVETSEGKRYCTPEFIKQFQAQFTLDPVPSSVDWSEVE